MQRSYFRPVDDAIAEFLDALYAELLDLAAQHGAIAGPIQPARRPYSLAIDRVLAIREADAAW